MSEIVIADADCVEQERLTLKPETNLTIGSEVNFRGQHLIVSATSDGWHFATPIERPQSAELKAMLMRMRIRGRLTEIIDLEALVA